MNFRYKEIFRKFIFRHREPLRKLEPNENYWLYGIPFTKTMFMNMQNRHELIVITLMVDVLYYSNGK